MDGEADPLLGWKAVAIGSLAGVISLLGGTILLTAAFLVWPPTASAEGIGVQVLYGLGAVGGGYVAGRLAPGQGLLHGVLGGLGTGLLLLTIGFLFFHQVPTSSHWIHLGLGMLLGGVAGVVGRNQAA